MKRLVLLLVPCVALTFVAGDVAQSDDAVRAVKPGLLLAQANDEETKPAKLTGRLPNNYAKLGISQKQRESIYGLQAKFNVQIEELEKQILALRAERDKEVEAVLTPEQKTKLDELTAASKAKKPVSE